MRLLLTKAGTALALGVLNIVRAAAYRTGVRLGLNPVRRLQARVAHSPFFTASALAPLAAPATRAWQSSAKLFSCWPFPVTAQAPDWLANPFNGKRVARPKRPWWQIADFDPEVGDIKLIWELSRMDWVLAFAQRVRQGDDEGLSRLNGWLADWCTQNPPYLGPNWKCGQEASLRVMNLAMAAHILGQTRQATPGLRDLLQLHLQRIAPTLQYAMAQDNNHGTSEAAALFIGGSWLASLGEAQGVHWRDVGRRWLENRAARLIGAQGSFSQYSLNYHRLMLDTYSTVEVWRRQLGLPAFTALCYSRARAATLWLQQMVDPQTGDGPNLGANDGARLLQLTDTVYRDHRPSLQLAMALFVGQRAITEDGPWNHALTWLGVALPEAPAPRPASFVADDGGFAVLRRGQAMAMLRYPRFRFRPGQADALHLDLWLDGQNLLRDAGSYSYNTEAFWLDYFGGTAGHNSVQFDDRDQMPRLGRFLFGAWLQTSFLQPLREDAQSTCFSAGYKDHWRASHRRHVSLDSRQLQVVDNVAGFAAKAVLRWRLAPGNWKLEGPCVSNGQHVLMLKANVPTKRIELVQGWESRHYLEKSPCPVLELEVREPATLTTVYRWNP